jgi:hypothetical protein
LVEQCGDIDAGECWQVVRQNQRTAHTVLLQFISTQGQGGIQATRASFRQPVQIAFLRNSPRISTASQGDAADAPGRAERSNDITQHGLGQGAAISRGQHSGEPALGSGEILNGDQCPGMAVYFCH